MGQGGGGGGRNGGRPPYEAVRSWLCFMVMVVGSLMAVEILVLGFLMVDLLVMGSLVVLWVGLLWICCYRFLLECVSYRLDIFDLCW